MPGTAFTFTIPGDTLIRMLKNAALFAAKPSVRFPLIEAVHFELAGGRLTLVATDKYVLATETTELLTNAEGEGNFTLPIAAVTAVTRLKDWDTPIVPVTVGYDEEKVTFTCIDSLSFAPVDGDYIRWRSRLPGDEPKEPTAAVAFEPGILARLAKVKPAYSSPVVLTLNGATLAKGKPVSVQIGPDFQAMAMTVKTE